VLTPSDLSVVIVLYNSAESIRKTVRSVPTGVEVILVDNASTDQCAALALLERPDAVLVQAANDGFGAGCNRGADHATRPALLFLNPDAQLQAGCAEGLLAALDADPVGVFGPLYVAADGELVANCRRRSRPIHEIAELLPSAARWTPRALCREIPLSDDIYRLGGPVHYVQGACFMVSRSLFEAVGGFDEDFFLYSEEEYLADKVALAGGRSAVIADARVIHEGGASTKQAPLWAVFHFYRSRVMFYARRDGIGLGLSFAVGVAVAATARLAVLATGARQAQGGRRGVAWWATVIRGLRSGATAALRQSRRADEGSKASATRAKRVEGSG
jgi:GT2 family glycosyltransferase